MLQEKFGGTLKVSPQHFSQDRQTSKVIYRVNVYYEAPDYRIGDVLQIANKLLHVKKVGKTVSGPDLRTGKRLNVKLKDYKVLKPIKTTVTKIHPNLEVMDENFQSVPVQNKKDVKHGEKVKIINDNGSYYLL